MYSVVSVSLKTNISQTLRLNNSRILRIKNSKFSGYYFYMNTSIKRDLQIFISVPLNKKLLYKKLEMKTH